MQKIFLVLFLLSWRYSNILPAQQPGREWEETDAPKDTARVLQHFPEGSRSLFARVPMRDGNRLATSVFLPPGEGPWPVIFCKGFYGRFSMAGYARDCKKGQFAFVMQDSRGTGDSEGNETVDSSSFAHLVPDTSDSLDWISFQPWCNGRIGMRGGSGNGVAPLAGFLSGNPNLKIISAGNSGAHSYYWMAENRVRRGLYNWMKYNGLDVSFRLRPTTVEVTRKQALKELGDFTPHPDTVLLLSGAWYDIVGESSLDLFSLHATNARIYATVSPGWHGGQTQMNDAEWPRYWNRGFKVPGFTEILLGANPSETSFLRYYLMGDPTNVQSGGNEWKTAKIWPPKSSPMRFHLTTEAGLKEHPPAIAGSITYEYDPSDPAPALGGNGSYIIPVGPMDQRPLVSRKDVLRFATEPLNEPLTITGSVNADLYFSTDVEDTLFIVKILDVHPDGRETLLRESAAMARYAEGLDGKTPLSPDKIYHLSLGLWSTAKVLNKGHRLGVLITSSAVLEGKNGKKSPVFEVHPNHFFPAENPDEVRTARQVLHFSRENPTSVTLQIVTSP